MPRSEMKLRSDDYFPPCLLSRLTDYNPQDKKENFSAAANLKQLKADIINNLDFILNSHSRPQDWELEDDPELLSSVLGMGLNDFSGSTISRNKQEYLRDNIIRQLQWFEPRINPESIEVKFSNWSKSMSCFFNIEITGIIEVEPLRGELLFVSQLDMEGGSFNVNTATSNIFFE